MPIVEIKLIERVFTDDEKRQMIEKVTDTMVSISGEALRQSTTVLVQDVKSGDWGIGGRPITTEMVHQMSGRQAAPA
ncbi:MAG: tautomerase family protein [Acidimicrobiales bacterium]